MWSTPCNTPNTEYRRRTSFVHTKSPSARMIIKASNKDFCSQREKDWYAFSFANVEEPLLSLRHYFSATLYHYIYYWFITGIDVRWPRIERDRCQVATAGVNSGKYCRLSCAPRFISVQFFVKLFLPCHIGEKCVLQLSLREIKILSIWDYKRGTRRRNSTAHFLGSCGLFPSVLPPHRTAQWTSSKVIQSDPQSVGQGCNCTRKLNIDGFMLRCTWWQQVNEWFGLKINKRNIIERPERNVALS